MFDQDQHSEAMRGLIADAAEAVERIGEDELERWAAEHPATGCRSCDEAGQPCSEHAFQMYVEAAPARLDRWVEALQGARLHFYARIDSEERPAVTSTRYRRWQALYIAGRDASRA